MLFRKASHSVKSMEIFISENTRITENKAKKPTNHKTQDNP